MIANILIFLVIVLLLILGAWLTWRAVRARRTWVKIVGGLPAALLTLVLAAVTFFAGRGLARAYIPPAPVPDLQVAGTPEQIARGEYLVNVSCVGCHGANGSAEHPLTGGLDFSSEIPMPVGSIMAANITPAGVLAERTDGELFRSLRYGFGPSGHLPFMAFMPYRQLSDADTEAVIAYLRSLEPVPTADNGGSQINLLGTTLFLGLEIVPLPETPAGVITAPPAGENAEYGKYVATFGECRGCHGPNMTGMEETAVSEAIPNPRPFVSTVSHQEFVEMMRTGVRPDGRAFPGTMPWQNASKMTEDDLAALYAYLTTDP